MITKAFALICVLALGAVCIYCAATAGTSFGAPPLFINFTRKPAGEPLPLYFYNAGKNEITLDAKMDAILFVPENGGNRFLLHLLPAPDDTGTKKIKILPPGESAELGDFRAVLAALPDAEGTLTAVYPGGGGAGTVKSLPMLLRKTDARKAEQ